MCMRACVFEELVKSGRKNMAAAVIENPPVSSKSLFVPRLEEVVGVLNSGLFSNFETVEIEIVDCPDLTKEPFTLACKGLGGKPRLVEIGGPPYLLPLVRKEKLYNLSDIGKLADVEPAFLIGAGAGPWPYAGVNCEMMINIEVKGGKVNNHTRISKVSTVDGSCVLERLPDTETRCALLANIFCSEGKPGKVLQVICKKRIGKDDFISSIRKCLQTHYKEKAVGLGGTFLLKEGKAKQHVMPEFSVSPINTDEELEKWLHFYNMSAPLIAVGTLVSTDPISGIAILAVGALIQNFYSNYTDFLHGNFYVGPVLLIILGVVVFVVAFFGCCGAVKENHCMIMTFAGLLLIVFGMELAGGITGYVLQDDVEDMLRSTVNSSMNKYSHNKEITKTWDIMQHDLKCCGAEKAEDWYNVYKNQTLPDTCCSSVNPCEMGNKEYYEVGCLTVLQSKVEDFAVILGGVIIGVACIQLIGVIFACCLAKSIRKEYESV